MKRFLTAAVPAVCLMLAGGGAAFAQEAIQTAHGGAPPGAAAAAAQDPAESDEAWARRVLNDASAPAAGGKAVDAKASDRKTGAACAAAKGDGKAHGEVWAGAGTGGYRQLGGVVTQPVGDCASVTLMINHVEGGLWRSGPRAR